MLIIASSIDGCGLWGPSYSTPKVQSSHGWVSKDDFSTINDKANLANMKWWEQFGDASLNNLVMDALKNNATIQQSVGNIIQAQGALQQVNMGWVPTIATTPGYRGTGTYTGQTSAGASNYTVGGNAGYFVDFVPSYTLNIMQQLRQQDAAKANLMAAKYAKDAMRLTVLGQVVGSYFSLRGYDYQLSLQKTLVIDTAKQYQLAMAQYKQGYISLLSLQNYQQQYDNARAQLPIIENNIVQTRNALRVLINKNPGDIRRGKDFAVIPMDKVIPVNLPSTVLKNRPDVIQAESQLVAANANIGVATATFFPSIGLTGNTGFASQGLNSLFNAGSDFWQVQVNAAMPILNMAAFGQIKSAKGAYYTAYWNYIQTVRNAFSQVDNGLSGHDKLTKSYSDQKELYMSTVTAYNLGYGRYSNGMDSYLNLLQYKITMDNAALVLTNFKTQQLQTIVQLYQALAGGYSVNDTDKPNTKFGDGHDA